MIYDSNKYGKYEVVQYTSWDNVTVRFLDTGYEFTTQMTHVRMGNVKDRLAKTCHGVGYMGAGPYRAKNSKGYNCYSCWRDMISRCYNNKDSSYPNYGRKGVTVCNEWLNFQNFAKWYSENHFKDAHLDKDIIKDGNRVYSPEFCMMVTQAENNEKAQAKRAKLLSPDGELFDVYNISKFCSNYSDLNPKGMLRMISGKRNQYKGWRVLV